MAPKKLGILGLPPYMENGRGILQLNQLFSGLAGSPWRPGEEARRPLESPIRCRENVMRGPGGRHTRGGGNRTH